MSQVSYYRNKVASIQKDLASLQSKKSTESKKLADIVKKVNDANRAMLSSRSASFISSKHREVERLLTDQARVQKAISDLESNIARKQSDLSNTEDDLRKEEDRERKYVALEEEKRRKAEETRLQKEGHERKRRQRLEERERQEQRRKDEARERKEQARRCEELENDKRRDAELSRQREVQEQLAREIEKIKALPESITVLFLAANPISTAQLRLDEEIRAIEQNIRLSKHRDSINLVSKWAVRPADLILALNECKPTIVHFSGHGSSAGHIVLQDDAGGSREITRDAIVQLMTATTSNIRLVFFNACFSRSQAEAVVNHVEAAIGMNQAIGDTSARVFAGQFYSSIGFGLSVHESFEQAKALLMLEGIPEETIPELFTRDGLNSEEIVLVRPQIAIE